MQQIKRGIYFEDAYLGVTLGALVLPRGTLLIDSPLRPEDARAWRSVLLNQRGGSNRILVLLDGHTDRTLGARALDCTILTHQLTAQAYRNRPAIFKGQSSESGTDWETFNESIGMRWALPDITFSERMVLQWGETEVILEHHPGPTPGAIWVVVPDEKVVYVGDAVLPEQPPFLADADIESWLEALNHLRSSFRDYIIVSGRGGPVSVEVVRKQIKHLKKIATRLDRLFQKNSPPDATEGLIQSLLKDFTYPANNQDIYVKRLRSGLYHYYNRHYRPAYATDQNGLE